MTGWRCHFHLDDGQLYFFMSAIEPPNALPCVLTLSFSFHQADNQAFKRTDREWNRGNIFALSLHACRPGTEKLWESCNFVEKVDW